MSEKLILELYERVIALEERVASLERGDCEIRATRSIATDAVSEVKGKYRYLADYLLNSGQDVVDLSFAEIEKIIQGKLPASSRQHRALWANTKSHSIALAWMNVGYMTANVDMEKEQIRFERRSSYARAK